MKCRILLAILFLAVSVASSAGAQVAQDPDDLGAMDSLYFDFVLMPDHTTNQLRAHLDLFIFHDSNSLSSVAVGFDWDNTNMRLDSAVVSPVALTAFNYAQYLFYKNNIDSTNANRKFQFSAARNAGPGLLMSPTAEKVCSYYFTLSSWSLSDSITVDTNKYSGGTYLLFSDVANRLYQPFWIIPEVYHDSAYTGPSNILLSPDTLSFLYTIGESNPSPQTVQITSDNEPLPFTLVETSSWIQKSPSSGVTPRTVTVSVSTVGLVPGTYFDSILVDAPAAINMPQYVYVRLTVSQPPPVIVVNPTSLVFNAIVDGANPAPQTVAITNSGGSTLNWTVTSSEAWLGLSPASGTAPGMVTVSADITGLSFGDYYDTILVSDPAATNDPVPVPVRMSIVSSLPVIDVQPVYNWVVAFSELPEFSRSVEVRNAGGGSLNYWVEKKPSIIQHLPELYGFDPDSGAAPSSFNCLYRGDVAVPGVTFEKTDTILIYSLDAINSPVQVALNLHITEFPSVIESSANPVSLSVYECSQGYGQSLPSVTFTVDNAGGDDPMAFSVLWDSDIWALNGSAGIAPTTFVLTALTDDLAVGTYTDTILVSSIWALNSPYVLEVQYNVIEATQAAEIVVPRTEYDHLWRIGADPIVDSGFDVYNLHGGCMEWGVMEEIEWLIADPVSGGVPGHVGLAYDLSGRPVGPYTGLLQVVSPGAVNTPHDLTVAVDVWQLYGDWDWNGSVNMGDLTEMITYLFITAGSPEPRPFLGIGDCDCTDGAITMGDLTAMIDYLFISNQPMCDNPF